MRAHYRPSWLESLGSQRALSLHTSGGGAASPTLDEIALHKPNPAADWPICAMASERGRPNLRLALFNPTILMKAPFVRAESSALVILAVSRPEELQPSSL